MVFPIDGLLNIFCQLATRLQSPSKCLLLVPICLHVHQQNRKFQSPLIPWLRYLQVSSNLPKIIFCRISFLPTTATNVLYPNWYYQASCSKVQNAVYPHLLHHVRLKFCTYLHYAKPF